MPEGEVASWYCSSCGWLNVAEDSACVNCGVSRPVGEFVSRPFIERIHETDEGLPALIAGATLSVLVMAAILFAVVRDRDPRNFDNLFLNSPAVRLVYALLVVAIPTQIAAIVLVVLLRRRRTRGRPDLKEVRIGRGRILGILGGVITIIGAFLPWATIFQINPGSKSFVDSFTATFGFLGVVVLLFGLIGLEYVAIPTEGTATVAALFGVLVLLATGTAFGLGATFAMNEQAGNPNWIVTTGSGLYVSILGALALIGGSALAFVDAKKTTPPIPATETPPSMP